MVATNEYTAHTSHFVTTKLTHIKAKDKRSPSFIKKRGKKLANFPPVKITLKPPPHNFEVTNMPSKNTVAKVNLMSLCCHGKSKKMHPSLANVQVDDRHPTPCFVERKIKK